MVALNLFHTSMSWHTIYLQYFCNLFVPSSSYNPLVIVTECKRGSGWGLIGDGGDEGDEGSGRG